MPSSQIRSSEGQKNCQVTGNEHRENEDGGKGRINMNIGEEESTSVDDDETSSSGSSVMTDDEDDGESSPETNTDTGTKPPGEGSETGPLTSSAEPGSTEIHNRLASFFSQLAEQRSRPSTADAVIEKDSDSDSGFEEDDANDEQQYIEIDLALGVLSEESDGKHLDNVEIPVHEGDQETPESDSEPMQKLTAVAKPDVVGEDKPKKRKIEELG